MKKYPLPVAFWLESQSDATQCALSNLEVTRAAATILAQADDEACYCFIDFCSRAADLALIQPQGTIKRGPIGFEFQTKHDMADECQKVGDLIAKLLKRLDKHESWLHLPTLRAELGVALAHPQIADPEDTDQASPCHWGKAGKTSWRNYLYRQFLMLNDIMGLDYSHAFLEALATAFSHSEKPLEPGNARYMRKTRTSGKLDDPL